MSPERAKWVESGAWHRLVLRPLMRAAVSWDGYDWHVTVLERSEKRVFKYLAEAKQFAEVSLREQLTAALARLPEGKDA